MLILAIPNIFTGLREPKMNEGLIVDVSINLKSIREHMMGVVLIAPPASTESKDEQSKELVQDLTSLTSAVAIVMCNPASLLDS